ncbi:hypothetical protein EW145_g1639 [Phellinidium pouzarii]|uniref:Uncharacterized protein n=1 Tax=Phellinidium pouzarii TaxID=167371 RepID=A0A4S4LE26_9AGAM|nr:hypothetical protein EW145_g1639 [Phellinidium pouzarii]
MEPHILPVAKPKKVSMDALQEEEGEEGEERGTNDPDVIIGAAESYNEQQSVDSVENVLGIGLEEEEEEEEAGEYIISSDSDGSSEDNLINDVARKLKENGLQKGFFIIPAQPRSSTASADRSGPSMTFSLKAAPTTVADSGNKRSPLLSSQTRSRPVAELLDSASDGDFPTPGTRAREEHTRHVLSEMTRPYSPAPGTRAAVMRALELKKAGNVKGKQKALRVE